MHINNPHDAFIYQMANVISQKMHSDMVKMREKAGEEFLRTRELISLAVVLHTDGFEYSFINDTFIIAIKLECEILSSGKMGFKFFKSKESSMADKNLIAKYEFSWL